MMLLLSLQSFKVVMKVYLGDKKKEHLLYCICVLEISECVN